MFHQLSYPGAFILSFVTSSTSLNQPSLPVFLLFAMNTTKSQPVQIGDSQQQRAHTITGESDGLSLRSCIISQETLFAPGKKEVGVSGHLAKTGWKLPPQNICARYLHQSAGTTVVKRINSILGTNKNLRAKTHIWVLNTWREYKKNNIFRRRI